MSRPRLLIVHPDPVVRRWVASALSAIGETVEASTLAEGIARLPAPAVDVALLDPRLSAAEPHLTAATPRIALCGNIDREAGIQAMREGFCGALLLPAEPRECEVVVLRALDRRRLELDVRRLALELARRDQVRALLGISPAVQALRDGVRMVAETPAPVLIRGEPGSGRALVARIIHAGSACREGPLVRVHLSSLAAEAVHPELHGRGPLDPGRIEAARGGSLLLADLESLPAEEHETVERLARDGTSRPRGGAAPVPAEVRLIATAGPRLEAEVAAGRIDPELVRAVSSIVLQVPPLRSRREDIPLLAEHFLAGSRKPGDARPRRFSEDALEALSAHGWPGNVRELRHVVETAALRSDADPLARRDLPRSLQHLDPPGLPPRLPDGGLMIEQEMADYQRAMLSMALERASGHRRQAAALLGLSKDQMKYLCRKFGL